MEENMKILFSLMTVILIFIAVAAGQTEFDKGFVKPWTNPNRAFVLDGRYYNRIDWDKLKADRRVAGMIFRSTGGKKNEAGKWSMVADCEYHQIRLAAKKRGYLWGSFHVGMSTKIQPAREQAQFYLDNIDQVSGEVMALDLEDFSKSQYMDLEGAREFVRYVFEKTGRYPLVYVTGSVLNEIIKNEPKDGSGIFAKTPLWFARSETNIEGCLLDSSRNWWNTYALWQFASELNCGKNPISETYCELPRKRRTPCPFELKPPETRVPPVPGVENDMDINVYNGSVEDLKKAWLADFK